MIIRLGVKPLTFGEGLHPAREGEAGDQPPAYQKDLNLLFCSQRSYLMANLIAV